MKLRQTALIVAMAALLVGCGSLSGRHNIDSGFAYIESHEYTNALSSFDEAEKNGEDPCLIHRGRGIAYLRSGESQKAVTELLASLAADEGIVDDMDFDTNYYLAEAYYNLGEYEKAKEVYDAILSLKGKDSQAFYLRGVCELASDNHDSAKSDFSKAIALNSRDYTMIIMIYKSLAEYGYEEEATSILQTAMDQGSSHMTNFEKGQISFYLGNNAEAQSYLEAARNERDQEKEPVVLMLGMTGEKQGDYNYAVSVYKTYLSENPASARVYNQLGMCQIKQGDYNGAISSFELGIAVDDKELNQALMLNEITAYEYMGDFATASSMMANYLDLYPDDEAAIRENVFLSTR
ncbi:tetratricopeptide repeat protein [Butyrivibrio proteoclasticus]|uniref:tetratricopeptide repeat protein n=1 Tax=Butyrivibrio proteoclasticus TaxID=43305 RepID=UPI0009DE0C99|nr:tetratricopeptide repeat protein [Butyrivibrio proteoclasticus]